MSASSDQRVTVTYADPTGIWERASDAFKSLFPLQNLPFLSLRQQNRVISALDVRLEAFDRVGQPVTLPVTLINRPLLNVLFIQGEDLEVYRQTLRQQIKDWLDVVATRKPQEWLIIHVAGQDVRTNTSKYLMIKTTVYDKIQADFNTKKDRCIQVRLADKSNGVEGENWQKLSDRMKEGIMSSFRHHALQCEDDVRRLDAQRQMPGWNYCTFFLMKENMAQSYEMLGLHDEALMQYDELEASYLLIERDNALTWFKSFGGRDPEDDSADIFDCARKDYRSLLQNNSITLFDLQVYMFSRQCQLLTHLGRAQDICSRAVEFISTLSRIIHQFKKSLPDNFEEYWIFSACTRTVVKYYTLVGEQPVEPQARRSIISLYYFARKQLDQLGIRYGLLPNKPPFSLNSSQGADQAVLDLAHMLETASNCELADAFRTPDQFDRLYLTLTENIVEGYKELGQEQHSWALQADTAALDLYRGRAFKAISVFHGLCESYDNRGWPLIEGFLRSQLAICRKKLNQREEYALLCLELMQRPESLDSDELAIFTADFIKYAKKLGELTKPFAPMFNVRLLDKIETADQFGIEVSIHSLVVQDFPYDSISLTLVGSDSKDLYFSVPAGHISPGANRILLCCEQADAGEYSAHELRMTWGNLAFSTNLMDKGKKRVFLVNARESSLLAALSLAPAERVNDTPRIRIILYTRQHTIANGSMKLQLTTEGVSFPATTTVSIRGNNDALHAATEPHTTLEVSPSDDSREIECQLPACDANQTCELVVPFQHVRLTNRVKVKVNVAYQTLDGSENTFTATEQLVFSTPISARPTIYQLEQDTLVKVELACEASAPVRLLACDPILSDGVRLLNQPPKEIENLILFSHSRTSLVFRTVQENADDNATMTLRVRYRPISDEVAVIVNTLLARAFEQSSVSQYASLAVEHTKNLIEKQVDMNATGLMNAISTERLCAEDYESLFLHENEAVKANVMAVLREFFEANAQIPIDMAIIAGLKDGIDAADRSLFCSIPLPNRQVITTAELTPATRELLIEEPCPCRVVVTQSCSVASGDVASTASEVCFDLDPGREQWIIAGQKRCRFSISPGEQKEFHVTLVPMKTGLLPVPMLRLRYLSTRSPAYVTHVKNVIDVLVKPKQHGASFFLDKI